MKKNAVIFIALLVSLMTLTSCGTTVYQLNTDCAKVSTEDLFKSITTLMLQEGFLIKQNDSKLGFLQAETVPKFNIWTGMNEVRYWIFQENNHKIIAFAKVIYTQQNIFGATTGGAEAYYDDKAHQDWTWYWSIRNGLEKICGSKIIITEKKQN
jgi:hypothetical protein